MIELIFSTLVAAVIIYVSFIRDIEPLTVARNRHIARHLDLERLDGLEQANIIYYAWNSSANVSKKMDLINRLMNQKRKIKKIDIRMFKDVLSNTEDVIESYNLPVSIAFTQGDAIFVSFTDAINDYDLRYYMRLDKDLTIDESYAQINNVEDIL